MTNKSKQTNSKSTIVSFFASVLSLSFLLTFLISIDAFAFGNMNNLFKSLQTEIHKTSAPDTKRNVEMVDRLIQLFANAKASAPTGASRTQYVKLFDDEIILAKDLKKAVIARDVKMSLDLLSKMKQLERQGHKLFK